MTEQKKRYTILGIFVAMFLFGAFFLRETGVYFDEHSEEEILYMNIFFYTKVNQTTLTLNSLSEKPIFYYFDYIEAFFKNQ